MTVALRVGALVLAVGLVVGAVVVRNARDRGEDPTDAFLADPVSVVCADGLGAVCDGARQLSGLEVRTAVASDTAAAAEERDWSQAQAWLVPAAWVDLVDDARGREGLTPLERSETVATTPLLLAVWDDRAQVLASRCGLEVTELDWGCVGGLADQRWETIGGDVRWGSVRIGHASPDTAIGLQATASIVAGELGEGFALRELQSPDFTLWFREVEGSAPQRAAGGDYLRAMVAQGPTAANAAVVTEAQATQVPQLSTNFGELRTIPAVPLFNVELVVAGLDADDVRDVARVLSSGDGRAMLDDVGWRIDGTPPTGTPLGDLPAARPTPDGGVLTALRTVWAQAAG